MELNTLSSWEGQTLELMRLIEQEISETESRLNNLMAERNSLVEALRVYKQRIGSQYAQAVQSIKPKEFEGKSLREMLHLIAERNDKIVVAKDAVKLLKVADVFGNPLHADAMVYSILGRSPEFVKIGRGIYRLNGIHKKVAGGKRKERISGLKQAILELKTVNPDMTKQDVHDTLIRRGFDFQGSKNPNKSIHMLWVNLGYAKKDKRTGQALLNLSSDGGK